MSYAKGIVQQISIKDRRSGQHGDFANFGINVNGTWHNGTCNADKNTNELVIKDKNWNVVKVGMEVEFMTSPDKQGYEKIDRKTMMILSSGSGASQPQDTPTGESQTTIVDETGMMHELCEAKAMAAAAIAYMKKQNLLPEDIDDQIKRKTKYYINKLNNGN